MKLDEKQEQLYHVWWQYLVDCNEYKDLCKAKREHRNPCPNVKRRSRIQSGLSSTYDFFGDVFEGVFSDWWRMKEEMFAAIGVTEFSRDQAEHEFDSVKFEFERLQGREASLSEFKELFMERIFKHLPGCLNLRVFIHPKMDMNDYKAQFGKLLTEQRKQFKSWENDLGGGGG